MVRLFSTKIRLFLAGFLLLGMAFQPLAAQETDDNTISADIVEYLKNKQVSPELKSQLDQLFFSPAVQKLISAMYKAKKWSQLVKAQRGLKKHGFIFLGDKFHIFTHVDFPGYVFKMALPFSERWEWLNAGRIIYADRMRETIEYYRLRVDIPKKWAYFMQEDGADHTMPYVLIVAEKITIDNAKPLKRNDPLNDDMMKLKEQTGFSDDHDENVLKCGDRAVIIDTEERRYLTWKEKIHAKAGKIIGRVANAIASKGKKIIQLVDAVLDGVAA